MTDERLCIHLVRKRLTSAWVPCGHAESAHVVTRWNTGDSHFVDNGEEHEGIVCVDCGNAARSSHSFEAAPSTDEGEALGLTETKIHAEADRRYELPREGGTYTGNEVLRQRWAFFNGAKWGASEARAPLEERIEQLEQLQQPWVDNATMGIAWRARAEAAEERIRKLENENARLREALRRISQYREGTEQPHEVEVMRGIANGALATPISSTKNTKNVRSCRRRNSQRLRRTRNGANPQDSETILASERQRVRRAFVAGAEWALEPYRELLEAAREYRDELAEVGVVVREDDSVTRLLAAATALNEEGAHDAND